MTDMEAIRARHTVRKYLDKPIPDEIARELREELYRLNRQYGLRMTLITNDGQAFGGLWKLLAKGVRLSLIHICPTTRWCTASAA